MSRRGNYVEVPFYWQCLDCLDGNLGLELIWVDGETGYGRSEWEECECNSCFLHFECEVDVQYACDGDSDISVLVRSLDENC